MKKKAILLTIDEDLLDKFKRICESEYIQVATQVRILMVEWLKDKGAIK